MKKLIILLIVNCALLIPSTRDCYSQFTWQKTYQVVGDDEGYDGCEADGSNFYVVGSSGIASYLFCILKIDQLGDTIWSRTFSAGGYATSVAPSGDGGCVFTGQRNMPFTIKMDLNGNIVWDKTYSTGAGTRDITRTNDSGYVMCGGFFTGYICKLDTAGNLQWGRFYNDGFQDFHAIELAIDGGYIVGGRKYESGVWKASLVKIDGAGNIIWQSLFDQAQIGFSLSVNNNGFIYAASTKVGNAVRITIFKTGISGNLLNSDTIESNGLNDYQANIIKVNSNKYVISFYSQITPSKYIGRVVSLDSNLNILNQLSLVPEINSIYLTSLIKAPNSSIDDIICIGSAEPNIPNDLDIYVTRIDSSLNIPPPISVTTLSNEIPEIFELFQNYPNPFNPVTLIKFEVPADAMVTVKVYDILGKEVFSVREFKKPGLHAVQFDGSNLASGMYFYTLSAGTFSDTKKMVLLK
jgi:hypothetical protein